MDTDFLTEDAYRVLIGRSGEVSEFLQAEIGASASRYTDEDKYLAGMHEFVSSIAKSPKNYLDFWNILDDVNPAEFAAKLTSLAKDIQSVMNIPFDNRIPAAI